MNSQQVKYLVEAYSDVYSTPEIDCQDLYDSILNLCIVENYFDTLDECEEFSELLVAEDLVEEFMDGILECYGIEDIQFLNESVEYLGENRVAALRQVINALSAGGRLKAGLKAGTAMGKKAETVVKGAAASTSIRSARKARGAAPAQPQAGRPLAAQQLRKAADVSKATKALPAAGQTSAPKPVAAKPATTPKPAAAKPMSGWERHNQAVSNAKTFAQGFYNAFMKPAAKKVSGAAKDPWTQFPAKKQVQSGLPKEGPSSRLPNRILPPAKPGPTRSDAETWQKLNKIAGKSVDYHASQKPAPVPAWGKKPATPSTAKPSTLRKDIRATGSGGDARTQRLASQAAPGSGVSPKVSKMADGASALNAARKAMAAAAGLGAAGIAANSIPKDTVKKSSPESSVNKYNTMDSDGKVRSRLKVGPKTVGTGSVAGDFDVAFKKARTGGQKEFEFKGKKYNTKLAGESVDVSDLVADMLLSEGYVDSYEDALVMMDSLDEGALAKLAAGAIKNVIKTGGAKLSKTQLPPKVNKAFQLVKQQIMKQYGSGSLMGTPQQKIDAAKKAAELAKNPPAKPKPRNPYPGDVYSKDGLGGIRGYRSGD